MKKLFNYALLAAALLIGVNVNAANVNSYAQLKAAIEAGTNADITLTANIEFPVNVPEQIATYPQYGLLINNGQTVTINLNGYNITRDNKLIATPAEKSKGFMFTIVHGTLNLTGEGSLIGKGDVHTGFKSVMGGTYLTTVNGIVYCSDSTKVTPLTESNLATYHLDAIGIKTWSAKNVAKNKSGFYECGGDASIIYLIGTNENTKNWSNVTIGKDVNILNEDGKDGVYVYCNNSATIDNLGAAKTITGDNNNSYHYANGVNIDIHGYIKSYQYGVQVTGQIRKPADTTYAPHIHIYPEAKIEVASDWAECTGIYAAGFGVWNIQGTVQGSTGAYIKSGDVTFTDATIESTNTNAVVTEGKGGGITAGGSGIVVDSNSSYEGGMNVTVEGDTRVTGAGGYGIEQVITNGQAGQMENLTITGGTIEGGAAGGIIVENENKEEIVIAGGSSSETTITVKDDQGETTEIGIDQFFPQDGESYHTTTIDNGDGTTTTVVTKGETPAPAELTEEGSIMSFANQSIDFNGSDVPQVVSTDLTLKEVNMVSATNNEKMTVSDGATLHVERLIMGPKANITVAKGGKLIVDGAQGIVANADGNIVIQAQEGNMGQFLFNPAVTSNRHPVATVRLYSKSFYHATNGNQVQIFGNPMKEMVDIKAYQQKDDAVATDKIYFDVWRNNAWDYIGSINDVEPMNYSKFDIPFGTYALTTKNDEENKLYFDMTGKLMGNDQPSNFRFVYGWTNACNSWTGNVDAAAMLEKLKAAKAAGLNDLVVAIYTYKQEGNVLVWNAHTANVDVLSKIEPMQPILFDNEGASAATDILSYENLVWNFRDNAANKAPKSIEMTQVGLRITAANGVSDRVILAESNDEDVVSAPKYMNEYVCVYANVNKAYDIYAADNIENTFVGFNCKNAGKYTISFEDVTASFALVDTKTNARIEMSEGATYEFLAEAGEDAYRFQIVEAAKAPTNTPATKAAVKATKALINDQIVINNGERFFNMLGTDVK